MKKEKQLPKYKMESTAYFLSFILEIPYFIAAFVIALITGSLTMYIDLVNTSCNVFYTGYIAFLTKKLQKSQKYTYNYGVARLETFSVLFSDLLFVLAILCIITVSVLKIINPVPISGKILTAVILKVINCLVDIVFLVYCIKIKKRTNTKIAKLGLEGMIAAFSFDLAIFIAVLLEFIFNGQTWSLYVEPISSIVISIAILLRAFKRMKNNISDITDKTLKEEHQFKILEVLNKHYDEYYELNAINSHASGDHLYVDLDIIFKDTTTYLEIKTFTDTLQKELSEVFEDIELSLVINPSSKN